VKVFATKLRDDPFKIDLFLVLKVASEQFFVSVSRDTRYYAAAFLDYVEYLWSILAKNARCNVFVFLCTSNQPLPEIEKRNV
jgi:hypothetical protein